MKYTKTQKYSVAAVLLILTILFRGPFLLQAKEEDTTPLPEDGALEEIQVEGLIWTQEAEILFAKVNDLRESLGLQPLAYNKELEEMAMQRAAESSVHWAQTRPDGSIVTDLPGVDAENLEGGISDPETIFQNLMHSPEHYAQMTHPEYRSMAIAAYGSNYGEQARWWVQLFSREESGDLPDAREEILPKTFTVQVKPELLELRILTVEQILSGKTSADFIQRPVIRIRPGDSSRILGLLRYQIENEYGRPGSVPSETLVWSNSNPESVKMNSDGTLIAQTVGSSVIRVELRDYPEVFSEMEVQVVPVRNFFLQARLLPEATEELYRSLGERYATLPPVDSYEGDTTPLANLAKESHYRFFDELKPDSGLQRFAMEMLKQLSLFQCEGAGDCLPGLRQIVGAYELGRISWHSFSDLDTPERQAIAIPGWARSMGALLMYSGGHRHTFVVFSENEGDGIHLSAEELLQDEARDPNHELGLRYSVPMFADRQDYHLCFCEEGDKLEELILDDPEDPRLELQEDGNYLYRPVLLLKHDSSGPFPPVQPSSEALFYMVDRAEKMAVMDDGTFLFLAQGEFTVTVQYMDLQTGEIISSSTLRVKNELP